MTTLKSQNKEAEIVLKYFKGRTGMLLDIGAFDGISLSNSYDLIMAGWKGVMLEPEPRSYKCLEELYDNNPNVQIHNLGIAKETRLQTFLINGMLSTLYPTEGETYTESFASFFSWESFYGFLIDDYWFKDDKISFVTIDAEGADFDILEQMDLKEMGTECLCIEHNGNKKMLKDIIDYSAKYGLKELERNKENIILTL